MDTQAGAQSATNSQTTIDLQAGIIAGHQDEIGRANVRITDQAAEIDRLKIVVADRNAKVAELMGAVARAGIDADEIALLKRQIDNLKRHIAEYCPAAPAAPSEQAEASDKPQGQGTEKQRNAVYMALHYYMKIAQPDEWRATDEAIAAFLAAAPAAPSEQAEPTGNPRDWLMDGSLIYRLSDKGANCDEINVTMIHGSRGALEREAAAAGLLNLICAADCAVPAIPVGSRLVPTKPNEAMMHAAEDVPAPRPYGAVYRAMIAAAPAAPLPDQPEQIRLPDSARNTLEQAANKFVTYSRIYTGDKQALRLVTELRELIDLRLAAPLPAQPESLLIRAYNSGYKSGHHDTVEGQYTDIDQRDMFTYHADVVADMIADGTLAIAGAAPLPELTGPSKAEKLQRNIMLGMADCMDMVRADLIEMGIIDKSVAPMFIPEAVANYCKRLAASPSPAPAQPTLCSDVQYLRNVVEDVKLALRNTDRQPLEVLLEGATAALEKSNVPPLVAAPVSQQDETIAMLQEICVMQTRNYGDGIGTHLALSDLCEKARDVLEASGSPVPVPRMGGDTKPTCRKCPRDPNKVCDYCGWKSLAPTVKAGQ